MTSQTGYIVRANKYETFPDLYFRLLNTQLYNCYNDFA